MKKNMFPRTIYREDLLFLSESSFEAIKKTLPKKRRKKRQKKIFADLLIKYYSPPERDKSLLVGYGDPREFNWKNVLDLACNYLDWKDPKDNDGFFVLKRPRGCFELEGMRKRFLAIPEQILVEASFKEKMKEDPPREVIVMEDIIKDEGYFRIKEVVLPLYLKKYESFKEAPIYLIKDKIEKVSMMISMARLQGPNVYSYYLYVKEPERKNRWLCFSFLSRFTLLHELSIPEDQKDLVKRAIRYLWFLYTRDIEDTTGILSDIDSVPGISIKTSKDEEDEEYNDFDNEYDNIFCDRCDNEYYYEGYRCDNYSEYDEYYESYRHGNKENGSAGFSIYDLVVKPHDRQDLDILINILWEENIIDVFGSLNEEEIKLLKSCLITEFMKGVVIDSKLPSLLVDEEKGVILSWQGWGIKFEEPFRKFFEHTPKWFDEKIKNKDDIFPFSCEVDGLSNFLLEGVIREPWLNFMDALLLYCENTKTCRRGPIRMEKVDFKVELDSDLCLIIKKRQKESGWNRDIVFLLRDEQGRKFYWSIFQVFYIEEENGKKWRIEIGESIEWENPNEFLASLKSRTK